jgi:FKBP-type peptidyl-prolyl cis-trans isomerase FkpA/FKBP-type peptidyl-prolyl cis-trans isomerase FklB
VSTGLLGLERNSGTIVGLQRKDRPLMKAVVRSTLAAVCIGLCNPGFGAELATEEDKTLYALGLAIARSLGEFSLTESELEIVKAGLADGVLQRKPEVDLQTYGPRLQQLAQARAAKVADAQQRAGEEYIAKAAAEPGAKKTESGAIVQTIREGTGPMPKAEDQVKVHYVGTLLDGTVFDSSVARGAPATFPLTGVIKCWTEGVQLIKVGGKSRLTCPSDIAYGQRGSGPLIKPGATLVFEVELLEIVK